MLCDIQSFEDKPVMISNLSIISLLFDLFYPVAYLLTVLKCFHISFWCSFNSIPIAYIRLFSDSDFDRYGYICPYILLRFLRLIKFFIIQKWHAYLTKCTIEYRLRGAGRRKGRRNDRGREERRVPIIEWLVHRRWLEEDVLVGVRSIMGTRPFHWEALAVLEGLS